MTAVTKTHVVIDDRGRPLVKGTRTKVIMIVMDMMNGLSAEQIHEGYPYLSLAQIHSALAYYYDHKAELDAEIQREAEDSERMRLEAIAAGTQITRAELERRRRDRGKSA